MSQKFAPPKPFELDRMYAILKSIADITIEREAELEYQVSTLVNLKLLTSVSPPCSVDNLKYKCNVNYEFVNPIAESLRLNLANYLID